MPIPCVDIIIGDMDDNILLLKRVNEPVKGKWWFPGGRILFNEKRAEAVARIALKECNIEASPKIEIGTFDLILPISYNSSISHAITTLYYLEVGSFHSLEIQLDNQSEEFQIKPIHEWLEYKLHEFVRNGLEKLIIFRGQLAGKNRD